MDELLFADVTRMRKTDAVLLSIFYKRANAFDDFVITINGIIRVIGGQRNGAIHLSFDVVCQFCNTRSSDLSYFRFLVLLVVFRAAI